MNIRDMVRKQVEIASSVETAAKKIDFAKSANVFWKLLSPVVKNPDVRFGMGLGKPQSGNFNTKYIDLRVIPKLGPAFEAEKLKYAKKALAALRKYRGKGYGKNAILIDGYNVSILEINLDSQIEQVNVTLQFDAVKDTDAKTPLKKPADKPLRLRSGSLSKSLKNSAKRQRAEDKERSEKRVSGAHKAISAGKTPKGINKLKAFMKENDIDLKTLKAFVKALTPTK